MQLLLNLITFSDLHSEAACSSSGIIPLLNNRIQKRQNKTDAQLLSSLAFSLASSLASIQTQQLVPDNNFQMKRNKYDEQLDFCFNSTINRLL